MADLFPIDDLHYVWELEDANGEWMAGGSSNLLEDVRTEGMRYLSRYLQGGPYKLIIREHRTRTIQEITGG